MTLEEWQEKQNRKQRKGGDGEEATPVKREVYTEEALSKGIDHELKHRSTKPTDHLNTK